MNDITTHEQMEAWDRCAVYEAESGNFRIVVSYDEYCENPRNDFDHLWRLHLDFGRYGKVDEIELPDVDDETGEFEEDDNIILSFPVFAYIHGGIALSLGAFHDPWDSGIAGYAFLTKKSFRETFGREFDASDAEMVDDILHNEINELQQYLNGNVYITQTYERCEGGWKFLDGCGGNYASSMEEAAQRAIEGEIGEDGNVTEVIPY